MFKLQICKLGFSGVGISSTEDKPSKNKTKPSTVEEIQG